MRSDAETKVIRLDGGNVTYAFGIDTQERLIHLYWGPRLPVDQPLKPVAPTRDRSSNEPGNALVPQEFPGWGEGLITEPALKIAFPDGGRDLVLRYVSARVEGDVVEVRLKDILHPLFVELRYTIDPDTGMIGRSARVENRTRGTVRIDQLFSAALTLPAGDDYRLHYLTGKWAGEFAPQGRGITPGLTVIESRRGVTGHQNNPWFAVHRAGGSEESGPVWFGALAWSGSFRITVDQDQSGKIRIAGGFNPFDFAYSLKPGEALDTPVFHLGYSGDGPGGASRLAHRFQRSRILPGAPHPALRKILYNSWEATEFAVDEPGQIALAERAAAIGVERFVMDDGWFGARNSDRAGLGDWHVNRTKFPNGLRPLSDKVRALGMEFGLWVEPEMVSPDSDLYRQHPDWVINFRGRPRSEARHQLVLNLARADVRDHLLEVLDDLVRTNKIGFLKWDHNRNWSEPGWPEVAPEDQQKLYVNYVRNLYAILAELRLRHPGLEIESCASGGGRVDLGIMALTDQVWTSDNTDPFDRLAIQDGFTRAYAPAVMMAWVTDSPNWLNKRATSLEYRFLSAMQGGLGIGADLKRWTDADFAVATRMVAAYKTIRPTVQNGDLYRLISPQANSPASATLSVATDRSQAVLFTFLHSSSRTEDLRAIQLRGLDPDAIYGVRAIHGEIDSATPVKASGAYWMSKGFVVPMRGDFQAQGMIFTKLS